MFKETSLQYTSTENGSEKSRVINDKIYVPIIKNAEGSDEYFAFYRSPAPGVQGGYSNKIDKSYIGSNRWLFAGSNGKRETVYITDDSILTQTVDPSETGSVKGCTYIDISNLAFAAATPDSTGAWTQVSDSTPAKLKFIDENINYTLSYNPVDSIGIKYSGINANKTNYICMLATGTNGTTYYKKTKADGTNGNHAIAKYMDQLPEATAFYVKAWIEYEGDDGLTYVKDPSKSGAFTEFVIQNWTDSSLNITGVDSTYTYEDSLTIDNIKVEETNGSQGVIKVELREKSNSEGLSPSPDDIAGISSSDDHPGAYKISVKKAGTFYILASIGADTPYNTAWVEKKVTINKAENAIAILAPNVKETYEVGSQDPLTFQATGVLDNAQVTFKVSDEEGTNVASITDTEQNRITVKMNGNIGKFKVSATAAQTDRYSETTVSKTITVTPKPEESFDFGYGAGIYNFKFTDHPILTAVTDSTQGTGAVTYKAVDYYDNEQETDIATFSTPTVGGKPSVQLFFKKTGLFTLIATKAQDDTYAEATAKMNIRVIEGEQSALTIREDESGTAVNNEYGYTPDGIQLRADGGSTSKNVIFTTVSGSEYAQVSEDGFLTFNKAGGSVTIKATKPGDDLYNEVSAQATIEVVKGTQKPIEIVAEEGYHFGATNIKPLEITGGSTDGSVNFETVSGEEYGEVSGSGKITLHKAGGSFEVKATLKGDNNYNDIESAPVTIQVYKTDRTNFAFEGELLDNYTYEDGLTIQVNVTDTEDDAEVTYFISSEDPDIADINGAGLITVNKAGKFTVNATIAETDNYAFKTISKEISVNKLDVSEDIIVTLNPQTYTYDGNSWEPNITVMYNQTALEKDKDYKVTLPEDMTNVGVKEITINVDSENYQGTKTVTGEIIFAETSMWGKRVVNNGVVNYESSDGTTSAVVKKGQTTWVKEESGGTYSWYAIDNTNGVFPDGSMFYVRWLNKYDDDDYDKYYDQIDDQYKNEVESDKLAIFLAGVKSPDGNTSYTDFKGQEVSMLVQLGADWDEEDIQAVFIENNANEIVGVSYQNVSYPGGSGDFANLTLKHFSPYAVYDKLTGEEIAQGDGNNNQTGGSVQIDEDNNQADGEDSFWGYLQTGDTMYKTAAYLTALIAISGSSLLILRKKRKGTHRYFDL